MIMINIYYDLSTLPTSDEEYSKASDVIVAHQEHILLLFYWMLLLQNMSLQCL